MDPVDDLNRIFDEEFGEIDRDELRCLLAEAIRRERVRCAEVADAFATPWSDAVTVTAQQIAIAIREGHDPAKLRAAVLDGKHDGR